MVTAQLTERIEDLIHLPEWHAIHLTVQFFEVRLYLLVIVGMFSLKHSYRSPWTESASQNSADYRRSAVPVSQYRDSLRCPLSKLQHQLSTILQAVDKSLAFVCTAQAATQIENRIVIIQGQNTQIFLQLFETVTNFLGIMLMGFCVGMVELIQHRLVVGIAGVKGMGLHIGL